jgi:hypothetical protein
MATVKFILQTLGDILKALAYGWILIIIRVLKQLRKALKAFCEFRKLSPAEQDAERDRCSTLDNPAYHRPDPCIYSQQYLMSLGLPVTWDNPDISLLLNGVVVPEYNLLADTEYEIDATVWNNSYDAPAVGMKVNFAYLSFGASTVVNPIGFTFVNLGVKGGPNHPAIAKMLWKTPPTPGHYCIQVFLEWIDDANPNNNLGQNNVDVVAAHSPATSAFKLRNNTKTPNDYTFEADTYSIPVRPDCKPTILASDRGTFAERLKRIKAVHDPAKFPVPAGWTVEIIPSRASLLPGEEIDITVNITPPANFTGTMPFNVNALYGSKYAGGVTLYVSKT